MVKFESSFSNKLIYVFSIDDEKHKGCLKVGEASIKVTDSEINNLPPNCSKLNQAARERIGHYTTTAGIEYKLEYTELAMRRNAKDPSIWEYFSDYQVRNVLYNSGIQKKKIGNAKEWVITNLPTVINAIKATKENNKSLSSGQIVSTHDTIDFRPEQTEAIEMTIKQFKTKNSMLWNAKMRFGKTLSALEVVKREQFKKVIIITHRPVVKDSWGKDFYKIFGKNDNYHFSLKSNESERLSILKDCLDRNEPVIHFASIQDLRGSELVGGSFSKNKLIFDTNWDLVIIDEAHEGTLTSLGDEVKKAIIKEKTYGKTKVLMLSGTPFNLVDDFDAEQIYTWDYVMEQKAKAEWDSFHALDSNPYDSLPRLEIYTYNLGTVFRDYESTEDKAFNFNEFFRTWTGYVRFDGRALPEGVNVGDFVHENDVRSFINLLVKEDTNSNYPFSREEYRDYFRHTLWMLPGVKEAKAFSKLLKENKVFGSGAFEIVNVAGDGDEEQPYVDALEAVNKAITNHPENTYTITLSCGRLTTGVSVKPWTAVMMLAGSYSTSAANYLQTIFRVQTPANINGKMKDRCYVFDFAPDRTLKMVAEAGKLGTKPGQGNAGQDEVMTEFLNFCPVIAINGSQMKAYDVNTMLQQIKKVYAERVVMSGFSDTRLYNNELLKLGDLDLKIFDQLKDIAKKNKATESSDIDLNKQGLSDEEHKEVECIEKKKKNKEPLTEEEKKRLEELKQAKEQRGKAIKILRVISIRIPMLIYGMEADFDEDITLDRFVDSVDNKSWEEFMPKGVTKDLFNKIKKYYDKDIFIVAGKRIRAMVKGADNLPIDERIRRITDIFGTFKNPDKETVLTPWRVVNMHLSETIGGYDFFDEEHKDLIAKPRFVDRGQVTTDIFKNPNANVLEINSKSGLYPLYVAYSIFRSKCDSLDEDELTFEKQHELWNEVIGSNIFVICKTPMAKQITKRTLLGYKDSKINAHYFENLINQFKNQPNSVKDKLLKQNYWFKGESGNMKFDAIVGNPPYQEETARQISATNGQSPKRSIFHYFQQVADSVSSKYVSLIYPGGRWIHRSGKGVAQFGLKQINDRTLAKLIFFADANEVFPDIAIADGISIVFKDKTKVDDKFNYIYKKGNEEISVNLDYPGENLIPLYPKDYSIIDKIDKFVNSNNLKYLHDSILPRTLFGIESNFVEDHPELVRPLTKDSKIDYDKEIKLYVNDKAGKAGKSTWFIVNKNIITTNLPMVEEWQVVVSSANAGGQKRDSQLAIIDNHSAFGRSRVALRSFKTQKEAQNFYNFTKTTIIKFMYLMTDEQLTSLAMRVPDLIDYSDDNKLINFDGDINAQLAILVGFTNEELDYMKSRIRV